MKVSPGSRSVAARLCLAELIKRINPRDASFRRGSCWRIYKVINILMESINYL